MKAFLRIVVLLAAAVAAAVQASGPSTRIVGGESTTIDNYPSMVQVDYFYWLDGYWEQNCAGTILTSRWVLSAAHCFTGWLYTPMHRRIRAGTTMRNKGGNIHYVTREINHLKYGQGLGFDADITLLELETALVYTMVVQPGTIVAHGSNVPDDARVVLAGWGTLQPEGIWPLGLQHVNVYTVNNERCRTLYNKLSQILGRNQFVTENMICTGVLGVGGRDACGGDSGGPLYYGDIVVGVVSWGHGCANETYPAVNTRVASYTEWIVDTVQSNVHL